MRIELLSVPNCPHVDAARRLLREYMTMLNIQAEIEEREGLFPSPTVLVDGRDLMGAPESGAPACRLDIPTRERILVGGATAVARRRP